MTDAPQPAARPVSYRDALALAEGHHRAGRLAQAEHVYADILRALPQDPVAAHYQGICTYQQGRHEEGLALIRRGVQLKPEYATAWLNLGRLLEERGQRAEAIAALNRYLELKPEDADAGLRLAVLCNNAAFDLNIGGQPRAALPLTARAIALQPDLREAHLTRALALLQLGEFAAAWPEYEWRFGCPGVREIRVPRPRWDGGNLAGRRILLCWEQGFGDTLQFVRYAALVAQQRHGRVVLECQPALARLLRTADGVAEVVHAGAGIDADVYCPLLSLPGLFGTTPETIPARVPYLRADPADVETWRQRLGAHDRLRVGLVWQGGRHGPLCARNAVPVEAFLPLLTLPGTACYSLQVPPLPEGEAVGSALAVGSAGSSPQAKVLRTGIADRLADSWEHAERTEAIASAEPAPPGQNLRTLPNLRTLHEYIHDFADTAAALSQLDVLLTVDTAAAHLGGALGVRTWLLLPHAAEWRWLLDRADSPWYPTMRLFRQTSPGDWPGVLERVRGALEELLSRR